jgi:competence protein ComFC
MKPIFNDFVEIFYPKTCVTCESNLISGEKVICTICKHDLPLTHYQSYFDNKITDSFYGKIPIEKAMALLIFRKEGKTKELIHELKYKGNQEIGTYLGDWLGEIFKENKEFSNIDFIIPVPLHKKKLKQRGYNQLTKFGETLSEILRIPFETNQLIKTEATRTQTFKTRFERFDDSKTKFNLKNTSFFENKHVLLIDDVITTGATMESCAIELLKTKGIKISVLAMAFTE